MDIPLKNLSRLPHRPGVYLYRDINKTVLYIGKAVDLAKRVKQYFSRDDAVGEKTARLVSQIVTIEIQTVPTEFDALLLEAQLIRKYLPKYNVVARDDKSPLYVVITLGESLPRVLQLRKSQLQQAFQGHPLKMASKRAIFGPFQSGRVVRDLLRTIRTIIPYCTQKQRNGKPCFYTHLGLCNPCPSAITSLKDKQRYRSNMFRIRDIFAGKSVRVISALQKEMEDLAKKEQFEKADRVKRQVLALIALQERRLDPLLYIQKDADGLDELRTLLAAHIPTLGRLSRIECIDISNLAGKEATGSLVVLTDGFADTNQYRRFRIHTKNAPNDVAMVAEVLTRRLNHPEWPYPDLLVIDGGKPQVAAAQGVTDEIPIIGLAKRFEEIIVGKEKEFITLRLPLNNPAIHVLQRIRDEAHRFAKGYHLLLRRKLLATI
ncbi:GIY-YIG nuclease family protein [Candidatus Gottesmanbacteria bacterium]|nr:GIY-YIG nuclease family protein [Candidatus Gottesmanbacteria bacterium]